MNSRKKEAAVIIHSFAVANAAVGVSLANTVLGDAPFLTVLNAAMVYRLGKLFRVGTTYTDAAAAAGTLLGSTAKTYLASRLVVWIPLVGNVVNASVAFGLTELMGWMAYLLFRDGKDPSRLSREEIKALKLRAELEKVNLKEQIENLPPDVRAEYEALEKKLRDRTLSDEERDVVLDRMIRLLDPYVHL